MVVLFLANWREGGWGHSPSMGRVLLPLFTPIALIYTALIFPWIGRFEGYMGPILYVLGGGGAPPGPLNLRLLVGLTFC